MNKKQIDEATRRINEQTANMFKATPEASSFAIKPTLCARCDAQLDDYIKGYNGDVNIAVDDLIRQFKANATICKECTFVDSQILERFKHEIVDKKKEDEMLNKEQLAQILQTTPEQLDDEFTQDEEEKEEEKEKEEKDKKKKMKKRKKM